MRRRRIVWGVLLLGGVVLVAASRPFPQSESGRIRAAAQEWAETNSAALPSDFESYAALSEPYRRASYRELSWATREKLWRSQLESFLVLTERLSSAQRTMVAQVGPLTGDQKALVRMLLDSVVPVVFRPDWAPEARRAYAAAGCQRSKAILGRARGRVLGIIGPLDTTWQNLLKAEALAPRKQASVLSIAVPGAQHVERLLYTQLVRFGLTRSENCDCAVDSYCDSCPPNQHCADSVFCAHALGCGCLLLAVCDGLGCKWDT